MLNKLLLMIQGPAAVLYLFALVLVRDGHSSRFLSDL